MQAEKEKIREIRLKFEEWKTPLPCHGFEHLRCVQIHLELVPKQLLILSRPGRVLPVPEVLVRDGVFRGWLMAKFVK